MRHEEEEDLALPKSFMPMPRLGKDIDNLALAESPNPTPFGTLSILPRELRDEVYSHTISEGDPLWFSGNFVDAGHKKWEGQHLSMLSVCKAIRKEFVVVLCSEGFFEMVHSCWSLEIQHSDIPFLENISNVIFSLNLRVMFSWSAEDKLLTGPFSCFAGTSIKRNACVIQFEHCTPTSLLSLLSSPNLHAMFQFTGFKTVQLVFSTAPDRWLEYERHYGRPGFDDFVLRTSSCLESTLGSFAVTRGSWLDEPGCWSQRVTFHPQGHVTELGSLGAMSGTLAGVWRRRMGFTNSQWRLAILDLESK